MIDPEAETVCNGTIRKIKWEENTYKRGWKERIEDMTPSMPCHLLRPSKFPFLPVQNFCHGFLSTDPTIFMHEKLGTVKREKSELNSLSLLETWRKESHTNCLANFLPHSVPKIPSPPTIHHEFDFSLNTRLHDSTRTQTVSLSDFTTCDQLATT